MKPNLIIVGAQKSGTTWLHNKLAEHKDFFMSEIKELNHFSGNEKDLDRASLDKYFSNFNGSSCDIKYRGESTPGYLWNWSSDDKILGERKNIPTNMINALGDDLKVIIILRNPVYRAMSAYFHHIKMGRIKHEGNFFAKEMNSKLQQNIIDMGFYSKHLDYWNSKLDKKNILILNYEDIVAQNDSFIQNIESFLGVDNLGTEHFWKVIHKGSSNIIKDGNLHVDTSRENSSFIKKYNIKNDSGNIERVHFSPEDLDTLKEIYKFEIEKRFCDKNISITNFLNGLG